jgi:hypothetical protein
MDSANRVIIIPSLFLGGEVGPHRITVITPSRPLADQPGRGFIGMNRDSPCRQVAPRARDPDTMDPPVHVYKFFVRPHLSVRMIGAVPKCFSARRMTMPLRAESGSGKACLRPWVHRCKPGTAAHRGYAAVPPRGCRCSKKSERTVPSARPTVTDSVADGNWRRSDGAGIFSRWL